jgi:hypothetical protein
LFRFFLYGTSKTWITICECFLFFYTDKSTHIISQVFFNIKRNHIKNIVLNLKIDCLYVCYEFFISSTYDAREKYVWMDCSEDKNVFISLLFNNNNNNNEKLNDWFYTVNKFYLRMNCLKKIEFNFEDK